MLHRTGVIKMVSDQRIGNCYLSKQIGSNTFKRVKTFSKVFQTESSFYNTAYNYGIGQAVNQSYGGGGSGGRGGAAGSGRYLPEDFREQTNKSVQDLRDYAAKKEGELAPTTQGKYGPSTQNINTLTFVGKDGKTYAYDNLDLKDINSLLGGSKDFIDYYKIAINPDSSYTQREAAQKAMQNIIINDPNYQNFMSRAILVDSEKQQGVKTVKGEYAYPEKYNLYGAQYYDVALFIEGIAKNPYLDVNPAERQLLIKFAEGLKVGDVLLEEDLQRIQPIIDRALSAESIANKEENDFYKTKKNEIYDFIKSPNNGLSPSQLKAFEEAYGRIDKGLPLTDADKKLLDPYYGWSNNIREIEKQIDQNNKTIDGEIKKQEEKDEGGPSSINFSSDLITPEVMGTSLFTLQLLDWNNEVGLNDKPSPDGGIFGKINSLLNAEGINLFQLPDNANTQTGIDVIRMIGGGMGKTFGGPIVADFILKGQNSILKTVAGLDIYGNVAKPTIGENIDAALNFIGLFAPLIKGTKVATAATEFLGSRSAGLFSGLRGSAAAKSTTTATTTIPNVVKTTTTRADDITRMLDDLYIKTANNPVEAAKLKPTIDALQAELKTLTTPAAPGSNIPRFNQYPKNVQDELLRITKCGMGEIPGTEIIKKQEPGKPVLITYRDLLTGQKYIRKIEQLDFYERVIGQAMAQKNLADDAAKVITEGITKGFDELARSISSIPRGQPSTTAFGLLEKGSTAGRIYDLGMGGAKAVTTGLGFMGLLGFAGFYVYDTLTQFRPMQIQQALDQGRYGDAVKLTYDWEEKQKWGGKIAELTRMIPTPIKDIFPTVYMAEWGWKTTTTNMEDKKNTMDRIYGIWNTDTNTHRDRAGLEKWYVENRNDKSIFPNAPAKDEYNNGKGPMHAYYSDKRLGWYEEDIENIRRNDGGGGGGGYKPSQLTNMAPSPLKILEVLKTSDKNEVKDIADIYGIDIGKINLSEKLDEAKDLITKTIGGVPSNAPWKDNRTTAKQLEDLKRWDVPSQGQRQICLSACQASAQGGVNPQCTALQYGHGITRDDISSRDSGSGGCEAVLESWDILHGGKGCGSTQTVKCSMCENAAEALSLLREASRCGFDFDNILEGTTAGGVPVQTIDHGNVPMEFDKEGNIVPQGSWKEDEDEK